MIREEKPDYEETIEEEADRETDCEPASTIPISTTYEGLLGLALTTRRGGLMKAARLPKPEDCTVADIPTLCQNIEQLNNMIGEIISLVGEKETKLNLAMEVHEIIEESFDGWEESLNSIHSQLASARSKHKETVATYQEFIEEINSLP